MGYSRQEILEKCENAIHDAKTFYQKDFVNYRGKTNDTEELYSEVIAEFICDNLSKFVNDIPVIARKDYLVKSHDGKYDKNSNRIEEKIAMDMFISCREGQRYHGIGEILDYQIPLKAKRADVAGKVDLFSYNRMTEKAYILELKKPESMETMLKCVLEGFNYLKTIDKQRLFENFNIPPATKLIACPFVFKGSEQAREMQEFRPFLIKLMDQLESAVFYISEDYTVEGK